MKTLNELVYGHNQAKKTLLALIRRSQDRYYKKCVLGETELQDTLKCLLIGQSGTGKTHLIQSLRKLYNFPLISLDATQLVPTGNGDGMNVKQLKKLINDKAQELAKEPQYYSPEGVINQMVIFVDEFDKLGNCFDSTGKWNQHVQANFLTMIDDKEEFSGISWIFAGAFSKLYENKAVVKNSIGFFQVADTNVQETAQFSDDDIIKSGIIPELLGRISLIVELDRFGKDDYARVLHTLLLKYPELTDVCHESIIAKAMASGQGIRSMTRQLEMLNIEQASDAPVMMRRG